MSLFQSLSNGIVGVKGQSNVIASISDNLANVSTVGYKRSSIQFKSLLGNGSAASFSPAGAVGVSRQVNQAQGLIFNTNSGTDLAISGNGYFPVRAGDPTTGGVAYTRAGSFSADANGDFRNTAGFFLQGWLLDDEQLPTALSTNIVTGSAGLAALVPVNVRGITLAANPTTDITLRANLTASQTAIANASVNIETNLNSAQLLHPTGIVSVVTNLTSTQTAFGGVYNPAVSAQNMASGNITPHYSRTISVIDNAGNTKTIQASFLKTAANSWAVEIHAVPSTDVTQTDGQLAAGTVVFNANGSLASISPALTSAVSAGWTAGGSTSITFDFGAVNTSTGISQSNFGYSGTLTAAPDYDPTISGKSMTSGAITPDFTQTFTATDSTGVARTLEIGYYKISTTDWAVEIYGVPTSDVTSPSGVVSGQVAYGTASFGSGGTLSVISPSLTGTLPVGWNGEPYNNSVVLNWSPVSGKASGQIDFTANPTAGDTLTLNGVTWTFVTAGAVGNQTNIGSSLSATLAQLAANLNASANAGLTPATYGNTSSTLTIVYDTTASAGNSFTLASSSTNGAVSGATLSGAGTLGLTQFNSANADTSTVQIYNPSDPTANMADGVYSPNFRRVLNVIDSTGVEHSINVGFIKTSQLNWAVEIFADSAADIGSTTTALIASGSITFNSDGSLASVTGAIASAMSISWALPAAATNSITIDWGTAGGIGTGLTDGVAQFDARYTSAVDQNGYLAGSLNGVEITDEGIVVGVFNNGVSQDLYQIPLANFPEQNELLRESGNIFSETTESGALYFTQAGLGGLGRIYSGALESSNVDVAKQLTDMIIAQRAYEANTKVITSSDNMLDVATQMKS